MLHRRKDQRSRYRVSTGLEGARLSVVFLDGPADGTLLDLTSMGCGFRIQHPNAASIQVGGELVLRLGVGGEDMPNLFVKAVVRSVVEDGRGRRVGVEFLEEAKLYAQLNPAQWRYFNRRQAFRVPPVDAHGAPLRARFVVPGVSKPVSVPLHDLSSTGLATEVKKINDVEFPADVPLEVHFKLPSAQRELDLRVLFVHRTFLFGRIRTGFRIDPDRTPNLEVQTESIVRYVLERQRQILFAASP